MGADAGYRGRFAPSPTGPLHFGSLVAALGSCLEARRHGGEWLVRIDDIDPPREQPGAASSILRTLERFGFEHDGSVLYQSTRHEAYRDAVAYLYQRDQAFPCGCTRKEVLRKGAPGVNGVLYPGTCRSGLPEGRQARTWRARVRGTIDFEDRFQGSVSCDLEAEIGDFLVQRADALPAYHLAAAVDDMASGITHVIRGHDLLPCTPPQRFVIEQLGGSPPAYGHLPLAVNPDGRKLSKQNLAPPLDDTAPGAQLVTALEFLQQQPPKELRSASITTVWQWALANWTPDAIRGIATRTIATE